MTLRFYMDHHVPAAITEALRRQGVAVLTAQEYGAERLDDEALLERATEVGRVLFSQDRDLLRIAYSRLETARDFSGLVYAHQLNITIGRAIRDLGLMAEVLDPEDMRTRIQFIPL